jgi:CheY-like chemotaxis protein
MLASRLGRRDARKLRLLAAAQNAAERGAQLTAQLLAFSRKQRMAPEPVDLNRIVAGMGTLLQSTIGTAVGIEARLAEGLWPALADPSQIELALLNLAINARDAMPVGGAIAIETANATLGPPSRPEEPPAGEYAMVSVADIGTGIAPEILDKVFEPFFTTKDVGKGSGLGLPQVLGVAQQLGGGVRIATRPGEGTTVSVYLPRLRDAQHAADRPEAGGRSLAQERAAEQDGVILLVDDDDEVRTVTAAMLGEAGYDVVEAGSGGAALDRLAREGGRVALMVLDFAMPGMNGVEVARAAQHARPGLPILFITGYADTLLLAENAAPDRILQKPFRAAALTAKVAEMLGQTAG